jgi:hypothetical protein
VEVFYSLRLRGIILFLSIDVDGPDIKENREEQKKEKKVMTSLYVRSIAQSTSQLTDVCGSSRQLLRPGVVV